MTGAVKQFPCPACGAGLEFSVESQNFVCKYCDSVYTAEQLAEIFPDNNAESQTLEQTNGFNAESDAAFEQATSLYNCPNCGAEILTDTNTAATHCFYCHSPVVLAPRLSGKHRPSKVIPFKHTRDEAEAAFASHCGRRWFVPKGFKQAVLDELSGIYVPYWTADCKTSGSVIANCKNVSSWTAGSYRITETKEYVAVRDGGMDFTRIPADASAKADDALMDSLEPFDTAAAKDFDISYLSGFLAERYDVEKEAVYPRIQQRAVSTATDEMRNTIKGYSSVNITQNTLAVRKIRWEHMLFPVWFLSYKHGDKYYQYAMNGQTGKFAGTLPLAKGKLALFCVMLTVLITLLLGLIFGLSAYADETYINDRAGIITDGALESALQDFYNETGYIAAVLTTDDVGSDKTDAAVEWYGDKYYNERFGEDADGAMLVIAMDARYVCVSRGGNGFAFDAGRLVSDELWDFMSAGDYDSAVAAFLQNEREEYLYYKSHPDEVKKAYDAGYEEAHYDYSRGGSPEKDKFNQLVTGIAVGLAAGAIISLIIILVTVHRYKIRTASSAAVYLDRNSFRLTRNKDTFIRQYQTRVKIETNSGGHSGGGHSGGGGGHGGRHF